MRGCMIRARRSEGAARLRTWRPCLAALHGCLCMAALLAANMRWLLLQPGAEGLVPEASAGWTTRC